ncbi:MAG: RsmB/NOP family class I SAM-dependent RNA methyltransferase, partial [Nocardioidaceae bacterium]
HQLVSMRVPSHAAVGTTVELVRAGVGERPVRLVNAVLRRVAEHDLAGWMSRLAPDPDQDPIGHLAVTHAHPRWIVEELLRVLDDLDQVATVLAADNVAPEVTLVTRPGLSEPADLLARHGTQVRPGLWSPYAAILESGDPGGFDEVRAGRVGIQDEGSQLVTLALARAAVTGRDTQWLDLCAGPGGKATLLTGLARERGATLIANERFPHRAALVRAGLRGYGPPSTVVCGDGTHPPWQPHTFDRVLVDAPCSGLGALRRRPESRWRRTPADVVNLVPLQHALLNSALDSTRPGGVVAYVTCSPHCDETRGVVDDVLAARSDVIEEDARDLLPEVGDVGAGPSVQLWPHVHGTDAMFLAVLRRS